MFKSTSSIARLSAFLSHSSHTSGLILGLTSKYLNWKKDDDNNRVLGLLHVKYMSNC